MQRQQHQTRGAGPPAGRRAISLHERTDVIMMRKQLHLPLTAMHSIAATPTSRRQVNYSSIIGVDPLPLPGRPVPTAAAGRCICMDVLFYLISRCALHLHSSIHRLYYHSRFIACLVLFTGIIVHSQRSTASIVGLHTTASALSRTLNKKLSYCWETVRRESMPRIAEMDVEITT